MNYFRTTGCDVWSHVIFEWYPVTFLRDVQIPTPENWCVLKESAETPQTERNCRNKITFSGRSESEREVMRADVRAMQCCSLPALGWRLLHLTAHTRAQTQEKLFSLRIWLRLTNTAQLGRSSGSHGANEAKMLRCVRETLERRRTYWLLITPYSSSMPSKNSKVLVIWVLSQRTIRLL